MQFRTGVQSHLVKRPCRKCRRPTEALKNGQMQTYPICGSCRDEMEKEYALAQLAANRQARNRANR